MVNKRVLDLLATVDMPQEHKDKAIKSFEEALALNAQVTPYAIKAPFAVARIVQSLPWEAEHLSDPGYPDWWKNYDNNVNVNGDKAPWVAGPDGVGVMQPCPLEDTAEARGYCYWAPGHHPRSKWARWVWLGIRNRATKLALDLGPAADKSDVDIWGDRDISSTKEGVTVYRMGNYYQLVAYTRWLKFFTIQVNYGFKVSNVILHDEHRAMVVINPWYHPKWVGNK